MTNHRSIWTNPAPRIGSGTRGQSINRFRYATNGFDLTLSTADVNEPKDWSIKDSRRHSVIVHLAGAMEVLETELEGHGGSPAQQYPVKSGRFRLVANITAMSPEPPLNLP